MADEVGPNYTALVSELLDQLHEADQMLETNPHAAVKAALQATLRSVTKFSVHRAPDAAPRVVPGKAISRFLAALDDRDRGVLDPVLKPMPADRRNRHTQPLTTKLTRAEVAVAMDLLMRGGRSWEQAAKESARILGENHAVFAGQPGQRWRIIARWRSDTMSNNDPDVAKLFQDHLEWVTNFLRTKEGTSDDLIRLAHMGLRKLGRYA